MNRQTFSLSIVAAVVLLALASVSGTAALATRVIDPFFNPFRPGHQQVISRAFLKLQTIEALHYDAALQVDTSGIKKISVLVEGNGDISDLSNIKTAGAADISFLDGNFLNVDAQFKLIGRKLYVMLEGATEAMLKSLLAIDATAIKGTWVSFVIPEYAFPDLKGGASDQPFYIFKKRLPDAAMGGQKIYRYLVALDSRALKNMAGAALPPFWDSAGDIDVELSIGSKNYYLYGITARATVDSNVIYPGTNGRAGIGLMANFSRFDVPVLVDVPAGHQSFEEVFR